MSKKIALIDGYGFVFRAYFAIPPLNRKDGTPVGAVYGFTSMLIKLLASLHVTHVAVVFDSGSKTFRNDIYPEYKANRPPCPEDLKPQFPIIREAAESLNLAILEKIGFEADDIIATIAKKYAADDCEVVIVSSDKDLMQLVGGNISMYDAMKNKEIRNKEVEEKFFVAPNKVLDVLSLIGDTSDNIPGVKGIGPKTAAELIGQFGDLENLLNNLGEIKQEKRRQMLIDGADRARISKILAALKEDVELGIGLEDLEVRNIDPHKLLVFLEEQGFHSLISKVRKEFNITSQVTNKQFETSGASNPLGDLLSTTSSNSLPHNSLSSSPYGSLNSSPYRSLSGVEAAGGSAVENSQKWSDKIKTTAISSVEITDKIYDQALRNGSAVIDYSANNFFTISTAKKDSPLTEIFFSELQIQENQNLDLFNFDAPPKQYQGFVWNFIEKILQDNSIKKIFFDGKSFLRNIFQNRNLKLENVAFDDVSLINHLANSSISNSLRQLIDLNLDEDIETKGFGEIFDSLEKNREPKSLDSEEKKIEFFAFKNFAIYQIYKIIFPKIFALKLNEAYISYELPLLQILARIEANGIAIDVKKMQDLSAEFGEEIKRLTAEIYALANEEFNIASPQQLSKILFEKLNLDSKKKSKKTGALSTNSEVLEILEEDGHEIARKVLDFRKFSKLKNTYTDALPKEINPKTNRIHTTLSSISTITGRLSSNSPNLQNIPIRAAEGKKIREAFIAKAGNFLISADYSQIELRVIAHVAKIKNLIEAFRQNKDIHRITASQIFGVAESEVSDELRSKSKAINFGIIYGISAFGLAKQLGISRQDASTYIKSYLETYPGIDTYMKEYINLARANGYVNTISGRKCFIRDINNKNGMIRAEAERLAINAPIQGSAADIIKMAMIRLSAKLKEKNFTSKIILQIHDELIIEAPENEVEAVSQVIKKEMENAVMLDVPLTADITVAKSWK
jgi:DNA polymerase-1